ncbi:redoxin domain-containing protein [Streptomyces vilmorinianum]|uniref:redoxin domain-containing protein n=1 Tax=Streptomyces vilmorinianum TaxID=3051092 RepID=UPI0010FAEC5B|nr:redoxin family protein [Streptomyces vilmorinianum]
MRARLLTLTLIAATLLTASACGPGLATSADGPSGRQAAGGARPGAVPDILRFTGTGLDGRPFEGSQLAGKPTVLWFWEPSCAKCRAQSSETAMTTDLYEGELNVVGIAGAGGTAHLNEFVASTGTRHLRHLADPDRRIWQRFGITRPGSYALLDATGEVAVRGDLDGRLAKEAASRVTWPHTS